MPREIAEQKKQDQNRRAPRSIHVYRLNNTTCHNCQLVIEWMSKRVILNTTNFVNVRNTVFPNGKETNKNLYIYVWQVTGKPGRRSRGDRSIGSSGGGQWNHLNTYSYLRSGAYRRFPFYQVFDILRFVYIWKKKINDFLFMNFNFS